MNFNYGPYAKYKSKPLRNKSTDQPYLSFKSSIEKYLNEGYPISPKRASEMISLKGRLEGTDITSFDEFLLFTSIRSLTTYNQFRNCKDLVSITLPSSVYEIDNDCFRGCSSLVIVRYTGSVGPNKGLGIGRMKLTIEDLKNDTFRIY